MNISNENQDKEIKTYKKRAVIVNAVFSVLFIISAVLSVFEVTALAGFIICCALSLAWTVLYTLIAHENLFKLNKSFAFLYIIIAAVVCGFTFFSFYICPKPQLNVIMGFDSTWNDIIPFIIGFKFICDVGLSFNKGISF